MSEVSQDSACNGADSIDPQTFAPGTEAEKFSFDLGYEQGWGDRNSELLEAIEAGLEKLIGELRKFVVDRRAE